MKIMIIIESSWGFDKTMNVKCLVKAMAYRTYLVNPAMIMIMIVLSFPSLNDMSLYITNTLETVSVVFPSLCTMTSVK